MRLTTQNRIIHSNEFAGRDDISVLVLSAECKKVEYNAFRNCKNLAEVIIERSEDKISIEFDAFKGCVNLVIFETERPVYFYKDVNLRRTPKWKMKMLD